MRILGMPLWPEKISDEQYVERVRKTNRVRRRLRYLTAGIGLFLVVMVAWLIILTLEYLSNLNNVFGPTGHGGPTVKQETVYMVYFMAITMGVFLGFMFFNGISHLASAFFDYRKDRLLVECWDALSDAEKIRLRQASS